jgi:hypothetical protein
MSIIGQNIVKPGGIFNRKSYSNRIAVIILRRALLQAPQAVYNPKSTITMQKILGE